MGEKSLELRMLMVFQPDKKEKGETGNADWKVES